MSRAEYLINSTFALRRIHHLAGGTEPSRPLSGSG
jgi:hypothetical protein